MKRLNSDEKKLILKLMDNGKSLNYINKLTGRRKSTLYYHYKKRFGKKFKDVDINSNHSFIGELVGLFVGDGYAFLDKKSSYSVRFYFNYSEKEYVNRVIDVLTKNLNKSPEVYRTKNVLIIRYFSKKLFTFLLNHVGWCISRNKLGQNKKSRTVFLKNRIYPKEFKIGFLRGFIDSDGYISKDKINFSSASKKIMEQTKQFLLDLGFKEFRFKFYKEKRPNRVGMYHINLRKQDRSKFLKVINPRNLVKLNASAGI